MNTITKLIINPDVISEICRDVGQVFFAGMFVGQLIDKNGVDWGVVVMGLSLSLFSWLGSLIIINYNNK